jgi:hypothetical protein
MGHFIIDSYASTAIEVGEMITFRDRSLPRQAAARFDSPQQHPSNESEKVMSNNEIPDFNEERYAFPVPEMPPVDNKMEPGTHKDNWLWRHYDSTTHS